jgi:hypothetical protein
MSVINGLSTIDHYGGSLASAMHDLAGICTLLGACSRLVWIKYSKVY